MKKFLCVLVSAVYLLSSAFCSLAASVSLSASCSSSISKLELSGTASGVRERVVYIMISGSDAAMSSAELISGRQIFTETVLRDDYSFEKTIIFPDTFPGGKYKLTAVCENVRDTKYFTYVNPNAYKIIADAINASDKSKAAVKTIMDANYTQLVIDDTFYSSCSDFISGVIAANAKTSYDAIRFEEILNGAFAAHELKAGAALDTVFSNYLSGFMNYNTKFLSLPDYVRESVPAEIVKCDFQSGSFEEVYDRLVMLLYVKAAKDYTKSRDYIISNYTSLGITSLDVYNGKSDYNKDLIMQDVWNKRADMKDVSDIAKIFNASCDSIPPKQTDVQQPTVSGNGGGGGGGGSYEFDKKPADETESTQIPEPDTGTYEKQYSDMESHWSKEVVTSLSTYGIIKGYTDGSFRPDNTVSRSEFAKMISYLIRDVSNGYTLNFTDINENDWFAPYVKKLASYNIINGYNNKFSPYNSISREEAAVIVYRLLSFSGIEFTDNYSFSDSDAMSSWSQKEISSLAAIGVVNGYNDNFMPKNTLTRAEAATMIHNLLKNKLAEVAQ